MKRGDIYRIAKPPGDDPKKHRYFVVVSRDALINAKYSTVVCAPIYSTNSGISTQIAVGIDEGLKHDSSIHCDALISIPKSRLTNYAGHLLEDKLLLLNQALAVALDIFGDEVDKRQID